MVSGVGGNAVGRYDFSLCLSFGLTKILFFGVWGKRAVRHGERESEAAALVRVAGSWRMRQHPSKVWLRRPPRRSAICKLRLHCPRRQRRFSGSFCSQREQFEAGQSSIRARLLEKEIIQTRCSRLNKISASARPENRGRGGQWKCVSISCPRDVGPARPERSTFLLPNRAPRLKREIVKTRMRVLTRFPLARERAEERQRSRSEADTGQCFGLCSWLCFGLRASSAVLRTAGLVARSRVAVSGGGRQTAYERFWR